MGKESFGWGDIKDPTTTGSGGGRKATELYMKLEPGNKYRVRMYENPCPRYFAWYEGKKYTVPQDLLEDFERHTGEKPRLYYVCNIIDREDTKNGKTRFKLLEKGPTVFSTMKTYYEETGVSPGGPKAPDFLIKAVPGKERRNTKYEVMNLPGESTFSEKEKELISRPDKMSVDDLKKLPFGEQGPIDIDSLYDLDKAREKVQALLDGKLEDSEDIEELTEKVEEKEEVSVTADSSDSEDEESLDSLIDQFD